MKTIKQWLKTIADKKIREAAISQIDENWEDWPENGLAESLDGALVKFTHWEQTKEGWTDWDEINTQAKNGQLETREVKAPKMKEGYIPYSNEQERLWAIAQAERMGAKEWEENQAYKDKRDKYICVHQFGGYIWQDEYDRNPKYHTLIPLERPEEATNPKKDPCDWDDGTWIKTEKHDFNRFPNTPLVTVPKVGTFLNIDPEKYERMDKEDGTIILKPKKKKVKVWIVVTNQATPCFLHLVFDVQTVEEIKASTKVLEVIEREYEI